MSKKWAIQLISASNAFCPVYLGRGWMVKGVSAELDRTANIWDTAEDARAAAVALVFTHPDWMNGRTIEIVEVSPIERNPLLREA